MGSEQDPRAEHGSATPFSPVKELFSQLRSSFFATEFQRTEKLLVEREEHSNQKIAELEKKTESLEKEKDHLFMENLKLKNELKKKQKELDALRKENLECTDRIHVLNREVSRNSEVDDELKKKQREIDEMKKVNGEYERREAEFRVYKKRFLDLVDRVSNLEKTAQELGGLDGTPLINLENGQQKSCDAESSQPPLFIEKVDSKKRTEPKFQEIIQIDDDDDDDDEDDQKCISTLKRTRVSYEIKRECNDDQPVASSVGKPCLKKLKRKHFISSSDSSDSDSDSDDENVDEVYKSIITRKTTTQKEVKEKE